MFGFKKEPIASAPAKFAVNATNSADGLRPTSLVGAAGKPPSVNGKATVGADPSDAQQARRRAAIAVRHSLAFAQIVSVLMRSSRHKHYSIADLEWLVLPPLLTGNFSIAEAKSSKNGVSVPVAVALWANVSSEVDKRLSASVDKPMRLRPSEWRSGDIPWLVDAVGDPRVVPQFLKQLAETKFKGRVVKVRSRGHDGKPTVAQLGSALSGAMPPPR